MWFWIKLGLGFAAVAAVLWLVSSLWQEHIVEPYQLEGIEIQAEATKQELKGKLGVESIDEAHKMLLGLRGDLELVEQSIAKLKAESAARVAKAREAGLREGKAVAEMQEQVSRELTAKPPIPNDPCASVCRSLSQPL